MSRDAIPQGTLQLLILRTLARDGEMHGFEIAGSIERLSNDVLTVEAGSLYPALQRLLANGWVQAEWGTTAGNRRARYYELTVREVPRPPHRTPPTPPSLHHAASTRTRHARIHPPCHRCVCFPRRRKPRACSRPARHDASPSLL